MLAFFKEVRDNFFGKKELIKCGDSTFEFLPSELWLMILHFLEPRDLLKFALISKRMREVSADLLLWKKFEALNTIDYFSLHYKINPKFNAPAKIPRISGKYVGRITATFIADGFCKELVYKRHRMRAGIFSNINVALGISETGKFYITLLPSFSGRFSDLDSYDLRSRAIFILACNSEEIIEKYAKVTSEETKRTMIILKPQSLSLDNLFEKYPDCIFGYIDAKENLTFDAHLEDAFNMIKEYREIACANENNNNTFKNTPP